MPKKIRDFSLGSHPVCKNPLKLCSLPEWCDINKIVETTLKTLVCEALAPVGRCDQNVGGLFAGELVAKINKFKKHGW